MTYEIETWDRSRAGEAAALVAAALPDEELSLDELLAVCFEDPPPDAADRGVVLATADGLAVLVAVVRPGRRRDGDPTADPGVPGQAFVKLLVVHPDARLAGRGSALLAAAEEWAWANGAGELLLAGSPPFYLWPGVDALATEMLCLAEARGYERIDSGVNMTVSTGYRAPEPDGVVIRRVISDRDLDRLERLVGAHWPEWRAEALRAVEHGCCHGAFATDGDDEPMVGFACHSVSRAGWLGPMGTDPDCRSAGVGRALLGQVCRDLMIAEYDQAEICWAGPLRFYAKSGATVSRTFLQYRLVRP